ncbi:hypothetical protein F9K33_15115 [bacterium]|nr:MAG: hypothetical protein F9K33_15115 [bacterium]
MKKVMIIIVALLFGINQVMAQENSSMENKVDSVLIYQKQLMDYQQRIYGEVKYVDPLLNKRSGIEFNPAYLMLASANESVVISGTYSRFDVNRKAELAFPFYYSNAKPFGLFEDHTRTKLFTLDAVYRQFLGAHQNGFYFSVGTRYAHIKGENEEDYDDFFSSYDPVIKTTDKFGVLAGIGYRYFAQSGFYWGVSISAGRYLTGNMHMAGSDGGKVILDIELLKFGVSF